MFSGAVGGADLMNRGTSCLFIHSVARAARRSYLVAIAYLAALACGSLIFSASRRASSARRCQCIGSVSSSGIFPLPVCLIPSYCDNRIPLTASLYDQKPPNSRQLYTVRIDAALCIRRTAARSRLFAKRPAQSMRRADRRAACPAARSCRGKPRLSGARTAGRPKDARQHVLSDLGEVHGLHPSL